MLNKLGRIYVDLCKVYENLKEQEPCSTCTYETKKICKHNRHMHCEMFWFWMALLNLEEYLKRYGHLEEPKEDK